MTDTDGYAAIASGEYVFTGADGLRCHILYLAGPGSLYLAAADESVWIGPIALGASTPL